MGDGRPRIPIEQALSNLKAICNHHDPRKISSRGWVANGFTVVPRGGSLQVSCEICDSHWVGIRSDRYIDNRFDDIIADALREGRVSEAITIFVESHWREIVAAAKRIAEE